jgi:Icc-related predicted phosphoesterase
VTRRVRLTWPDARPFLGRDGRPIRFLAASDDRDPALEEPRNRAGLGPVDGVLGCGDLEPSWLAFLGDAFAAPVVYVRGNHDHGGAWSERERYPTPLPPGGRARIAGVAVAGLEWPGVDAPGNSRRDGSAWPHVLRVAARSLRDQLLGRGEPTLVISHAPPAGAGDTPDDAYHVGIRAYRWLLDRLRPPVWLHGHTNIASVRDLTTAVGRTTLVNVTGTVLVELVPPDA